MHFTSLVVAEKDHRRCTMRGLKIQLSVDPSANLQTDALQSRSRGLRPFPSTRRQTPLTRKGVPYFIKPARSPRILAAASSEPANETSQKFGNVQATPVRTGSGSVVAAPAQPGIYAFYDKEGQLQYIGLSRKVSSHLNLDIGNSLI